MLTSTVLNTFEAIEQRRSIKHFDPNFVMPEADLKKLVDATLLSPTSFNIQNWRFVVVRNQDLKEKIKAAAWGQSQVADCSALFVLCANLDAPFQAPERYWQNAPQAVQEIIVPMIPKTYENNPQLQRDEAMRSIGIASQTLMLAAKAMGYDTCPMVGFNPQAVAELIHLPERHLAGLLVTVGKALKPANPRSGTLPIDEVVKFDTF